MLTEEIVVVEDEPDILEVLRYNLNREGFRVITASNGSVGLQLIQKHAPNLVLLDLMLPGMDGVEICRHLKKDIRTQNIQIIMVTAKSEENDIVSGLNIGADDYITKPFSSKELLARVRAVLRRARVTDKDNSAMRVVSGELLIEPQYYQVTVADKVIPLTTTEFRLLYYLARHPGQVFTRVQLLNQLFGDDIITVDRNVDVHVSAIRKKISPMHNFIETIRGVGYRFKKYAH